MKLVVWSFVNGERCRMVDAGGIWEEQHIYIIAGVE